MRSVKTLILGLVCAAAAPGLHAQATGAAQQVRKTAEDAAKSAGQTPKPATPANSPATKPAPQAPKTNPPAASKPAAPANPPAKAPNPAPQAKPATQPAKPAAQPPKPSVQAPKAAAKSRAKSAKPAKKAGPAKKPAEKKAAAGTPSGNIPGPALPIIARRDPFESMVGREAGGGRNTGPLPAGKAGLQVSTLRLDGVVRAPSGMIAVVSNPQQRTYFLREGDQLYDGRVEKIAMDGVSFHEVGKDAFGKPVERQVNKRIYASAGEQQ